MFADAITKIQNSPLIRKDLIEPLERAGREMDADDDETYTTSSAKTSEIQQHQPLPRETDASSRHDLNEWASQELYFLDLITSFIEGLAESMNEHLTQLRVQLGEAQAAEKKLTQARKGNDALIEGQRQANEELGALRNELEVAIENMRREVESRKAECEGAR